MSPVDRIPALAHFRRSPLSRNGVARADHPAKRHARSVGHTSTTRSLDVSRRKTDAQRSNLVCRRACSVGWRARTNIFPVQ